MVLSRKKYTKYIVMILAFGFFICNGVRDAESKNRSRVSHNKQIYPQGNKKKLPRKASPSSGPVGPGAGVPPPPPPPPPPPAPPPPLKPGAPLTIADVKLKKLLHASPGLGPAAGPGAPGAGAVPGAVPPAPYGVGTTTAVSVSAVSAAPAVNKQRTIDVVQQTKFETVLLLHQVKMIVDRMSIHNINNAFKFSKDDNNNLIASADGETFAFKSNDNSDSFVPWFKINYDYYKNSDLGSIHMPNVTLGGEYDFDNKYKLGLAYTFGYSSSYINNDISAYANISNISIGDSFKDNFITIVFTYGHSNDRDNDNKHNVNLISFDTILGHEIKLFSSNDVLIPMIGIGYNYINRNDISYNVNVITPLLGIAYGKDLLNDNLNIRVSLNLEYDFNFGGNNKNSTFVSNKIITDNKDNFGVNTSIDLTYKVKKNIDLTFDTNFSFDTNKTLNFGCGLGGRFRF